MITINNKERELTAEETETVTSMHSDFGTGVDTYYQGDEPVIEQVTPPNWRGLVIGLRESQSFMSVLIGQTSVNQIAYSTLMKVLTDGENGYSTESFLLQMLQVTCSSFSQTQKDEINQILINNQFSIQL